MLELKWFDEGNLNKNRSVMVSKAAQASPIVRLYTKCVGNGLLSTKEYRVCHNDAGLVNSKSTSRVAKSYQSDGDEMGMLMLLERFTV
ncbi:hypothetical protein BLOT_011167 [Blomia tropicalis]|nr:hypothetical protein BLOT_011167 [Blomia tropicalis]